MEIHFPPPKFIPQVSFNGITRLNEYHQADILYMPWDTVKGKVYKYCLNIVDVASRYKASVPLIDRSSVSVAKAFKRSIAIGIHRLSGRMSYKLMGVAS